MSAPPGNQTFAFTLFDGPNGTGKTLGTATASATVVAGQPFSVSVAVSGVAQTVTITASLPVVSGIPTSVPLAVQVKDADGNVIAGSAPYAQPITLQNMDTSGQTSLSTTTVTSPSTAVNLVYTGGSLGGASTIKVQGSVAASSVTVTAATVTVLSVPGYEAQIQYGPGGAGTPNVDHVAYSETLQQLNNPNGNQAWSITAYFQGLSAVATVGWNPWNTMVGGAIGPNVYLTYAGSSPATSVLSNCVPSTINGPCTVPYTFTPGIKYRFDITVAPLSASAETLSATVTDTSTSATTSIGQFTVPIAAGLLSSTQVVSTYYGGAIASCAAQAYARVLTDQPATYLAGVPYPPATGAPTTAGLACNALTKLTPSGTSYLFETGQ